MNPYDIAYALALGVVLAAGLTAISLITTFVVMRPKKSYPQDTFQVSLPSGKSIEIVGHLRVLPNGILTFVNEAGKSTHTFGIGGWWCVVKTGLGSERGGA